MDKIRVNGKKVFEIEVNDNGDTIKLNLGDMRLVGKMLNMLADIDEKQKEYEQKAEEIISRPDKPLEGYEESKVPVTQNFVDFIQLNNDFCELCRGYIDDIFGNGASMKIFGEANDPDMFEEFFEKLNPYISESNVSVQDLKEDLVEKYTEKNDSDVI